VGVYALRGLARLQAPLPPRELQTLLAEQSSVNGSSPDRLFTLGLLKLFRTPEALELAMEVLQRWSAEDRSRLLLELNSWVDPIAPEVTDWLYARWLAEDRSRVQDVQDEDCSRLNVEIAFRTLERPESRALLVEYWRQARGDERRELLDYLGYSEDALAEVVTTNERERRELIKGLALPHSVLVDFCGEDELLQQIEETLRRENRLLRSGGPRRPHFPPPIALRALRLLAHCQGANADARISSLVCCPDIDWRLRERLLEIVWERDPAEFTMIAHAATHPGNRALARCVLRWMSQEPRAADTDFLLWATDQQTDAEFRYRAVELLEMRGENSPAWQQRLEGLSRDSDPFVRLQAVGALVRRGDASRLAEVVHAATNAKDVCVRAEAVRVLEELDPASHFPILRNALLEDHEDWDGYFTPVAEEAAFALARLGTPDAVAVLAQGYLLAPGNPIWDALDDYLAVLLDRLEGRERPLDLFPNIWRRCRFPMRDFE